MGGDLASDRWKTLTGDGMNSGEEELKHMANGRSDKGPMCPWCFSVSCVSVVLHVPS